MSICTLGFSINYLSGTEIIYKVMFYKFHSQLISSLPMKDALFLSHIHTLLLPLSFKQEVQLKTKAAEAACFFLDKRIRCALEVGETTEFAALLQKMETYNNISLKELAQTIKKDLQGVTGKIHMIDSIMYTCCIICL